jgi:hypothetical protein
MTSAAPTRTPVRSFIGACAMAVLLVAAWIIPPLAILIVWPLLFVLPGWVAVSWLAPRLAAPGRLGLAIVGSIAVSAHLVFWVSVVIGAFGNGHGYGRPAIFVAAALLAIPVHIALARGRPPSMRRARRAVARHRAAFAIAAAAAGFVTVVLGLGLWHLTPDGVSSGGSNWSDLPVHLAIAQSLNAGNFPPQVPYFAGVPLVYHWFADFHAAIAADAAGLFAIPAFIAGSAIGAAALALCVHGLAIRLVRGPGARRVALVAMALVVFAGGLGWTRLVSDLAGGGDLAALVTHNSYDNFWYDSAGAVTWPYFRIPSVMGTGLLVHRATALGLPMLVGAVLLLTLGLPTRRERAAAWRDRRRIILAAGVLIALLAPFHFFFFPAVLLIALLWVLIGGRLVDRAAPGNALLLLAPLLLALPFALPALTQAGGSGALVWVRGWESAPRPDGLAAVAFFYVTNLGVPFALAIVAVLVGLVTRRASRRAFLAAWMAALFTVPNVVQASVIAFDMNKLFQAMWPAAVILAAWLMRRWPWPAIAAVVLLSVPSPLLVGAWSAAGNLQMLSRDQLAAADWAATTPQRSVFVTDGWLHSFTDPAGRLRVGTFGPYVANLGYDPDPRGEIVHEIYCGGDAAHAVDLARGLGAGYVVDAGRPTPCPTPTDFATDPRFRLAYENRSLRVWLVSSAGP